MLYVSRHISLAFILTLLSASFCKAQDEILITGTPESYPGAMDGQMILTVQSVGNGPGQNPPPFTFKLDLAGENPVLIENSSGVAIFTGLGYKYYTLTALMGNGCSGSASFYFDNKCTADCLVADFNFEYNYDGCSVLFEDWSESGSNSWQWDFGDGGTSTEQNPAHIYSESGCYPVKLTVSNGTQTRTLTKQICITGCSDNGPSYPECHINGPTLAGAGQTVTLSGSPTGIGPFDYDWTTPPSIAPSPNGQSASILVTLPAPGVDPNGMGYNFTLVATDNNGYSSSPCMHTITLSGNIPDVELAAFGSFQPNMPLVLVAFADVFNLTGPEQYYFTVYEGNELITIPNSCLNIPQNFYDCTLAGGLAEGFYTIRVDVTDAVGTYSDWITVTIGSPTPIPPSPAMWLEVKYPDNPVVDPVTGHYVLESGELFQIGIDGNHPFSGFASCTNGDRYFAVLHIKNLTMGDEIHIGDPLSGQPGYMDILPDIGLNLWNYEFGTGCTKGTLRITADIYKVDCQSPYPVAAALSQFPEMLYHITQPIFVDLHPAKPDISEIIVDYSSCDQPATATVRSGCSIESYEWHAYDPSTNEEITDFFTGNANSATVTPNLSHLFFERFPSGEITKIRCEVNIVDVNGFTAELSAVIKLRVPLRFNVPANIYRCPGTIGKFSDGPLASGGILNSYTFTWANDLTGDNPTFTAPQQGSEVYEVTVSDGANCSLTQTITVTAAPLNFDIWGSWLTCAGGGNQYQELGADPHNLGGSGNYTFTWTAADPAHLDYLSDANIPNPVIQGFPAGQNIIYTLTVADIYGGCTANENITVTSVANDLSVNLTGPPVICARDEEELLAQGTPVGSGWGAIFFQYQWTTTNRHHDLSAAGNYTTHLPVDELVSSFPGNYLYKVRYMNIISGCYAEDEVTVVIKDSWKYTGYQPAVKSAVAGSSVPLWEGNNNYISSGLNLSNISVIWSPAPPTTLSYYGNTQLPQNGTFTPTIQTPYLTMTVIDNVTGCSKRFKTMRYILSGAEPELWMAGDNPNVCVGGAVCFDLYFDAHLANYQTSLLPRSVRVNYTITPPANAQQAPYGSKTVVLELDNSSGLYKGRVCESDYFQYVTNPGGLEAYWFSVSLSASEYPIWGYTGSPDPFLVYVDEPLVSNAFVGCTPSGTIVRRTTITLGIQCAPGSTPVISGPSRIMAKNYIEILPDGGIEIVPASSNPTGPHFSINPCILEQEPPPKNTNFTEESPALRNLASKLSSTPNEMELEIHPNPFTGKVNIQYLIEAGPAADVTINLLDFTGKLIQVIRREEDTLPGYYETTYDGGHLSQGVYLYQLVVESKGQITKKAIKIGF
ncbi:MAG: PKD domain-containing protein [Lewinellaceae bacterium]|nr:PKD domain-containing protein [Lewinellaceae bacterium]